jgi:hypothetical protein
MARLVYSILKFEMPIRRARARSRAEDSATMYSSTGTLLSGQWISAS